MRIGIGVGTIMLLAAGKALATDPALPLNITSGYNADIIANGSGSASTSTSGGFDAGGNIFYDSTYDNSHGQINGALPAGQTFNDYDGNQYHIASATGNNALVISSENTSGTLGISYADNASLTSLILLGTSGEGDTILDYTLNFSGGVTSSGTFTLANWYNPGASGAFNSFGRINVWDEYSSETGRAFSLYTVGLAIPDEDTLLRLESVTLSYNSENVDSYGIFPRAAILGISAFDPVITPVPEPTSSSLAICGALVLAGAAGRKFFKN